MKRVKILFFSEYSRPNTLKSDDSTYILFPNSYINSAVKITCLYITGENTGYKPDTAASGARWQGPRCRDSGRAVTWPKEPELETPLE